MSAVGSRSGAKDDPREHYATQAEDAERMYDSGHDYPQARRLETIRALLDSVSIGDKAALDIGSGDGYGLSEILRAGSPSSILAVDLSYPKLSILRRRIAGSMPVAGDAELLPVRDGVIEVALCFETLEHLANPRKALSEAARVLVAGGALILSVPIDGVLQVWWDRLRACFPGSDRFHEHIQVFTSRGLRRLLEDSGFRIEKVAFVAFAVPLLGGLLARLPYHRYAAVDRLASRIPLNHFGVGGHSVPFAVAIGRRYVVAVLRRA